MLAYLSPLSKALTIIHLGAVDSTQSFLARHPELGFCGVMADTQTAGRGRGNNSWESRPGAGLWLSACLPPSGISAGTILQSAMAAAAEVLEPCGIPLGLKWPNDLVAYSNSPCEWHGVPGLRREWSEPPQAESETESATTNCGHKVQPTGKLLYKQNGHWKSLVKIGGIIGEQKNGRIILGMGLNIFHAPELPERAIPPASLSSLGAVNIPEMTTLAKKILSAWQNLDKQRTAAFRWPEQGDTIRWEAGSGTCQGWEPDGRLAVRTESGLVLLTSGDVSGLT